MNEGGLSRSPRRLQGRSRGITVPAGFDFYSRYEPFERLFCLQPTLWSLMTRRVRSRHSMAALVGAVLCVWALPGVRTYDPFQQDAVAPWNKNSSTRFHPLERFVAEECE